MPEVTSAPDDYAAATTKATDATAALRRQLLDPAFTQQARRLMQARTEYEKTAVALRKVNEAELIRVKALDLQRRYGRAIGGALGAGQRLAANPLAQVGVGKVQEGAGYVRGMAARGMSGTVEQGRLEAEMTLLAREFAGVMKPITEVMTSFATKARRAMERFSAADQDKLMYGTLAVGAAAAAYRYRRPLTAAAGLARSLVTGTSAASRVAASGPMDMAALATANVGRAGAGAAESASLLSRAGRTVGRVGRVVGRVAKPLMVLDMAASVAEHGTTHAERENPYTYTFREQNPEMAEKLDAMTKKEMKANWKATEQAGRPYWIPGGLSTIGKWGRNAGAWMLNQVPIGGRIKYMDEYSEHDQLKREVERRTGAAPGGDRRMVVQQGGGVQEAGAGYYGIMAAYGKTAYGARKPSDEGGAEDGPVVAELKKVNENLEKLKPQPEVR